MRLIILWQVTEPATHDEQKKLALSPGEPVGRTARVRFYNDQALSYELLSVAIKRVPKNGANKLSDIDELAASGILKVGRAEETISQVPADADVASHLGVRVGQVVTLLDRIVWTDTQLPIEWRLSFSVVRLY